ncbi:Microsomal glutathione S-transferase 3 [Mortierella claussenii]|nr:Microsomal glutathione S-transferase 3 [Mortierella claussenii]
MTTITLAPEYGYVVAVSVVSAVLVLFFGARVTNYRKVAKVPLPFMYADASECKEDHQKYIFNCYQRVHQNTLEGFSAYLATLLLAGIEYPIASAALGGVWCLGRIFYYIGYTSGNPSARMMGAFGHIGEVGLLGLTGKFAYDLIVSRF